MSYFDDVDGEDPDTSLLKKVKTAKVSKAERVSDKSTRALDVVAEEQGWKSRSPKKPGPKRREPRTVLTMNGPKRVLDAFRDYADQNEVSQWQALEIMMKKIGLLT